MANLKSRITANKVKWIVTFILLIVLSFGLIGVSVKLNNSIKTKNIPVSAYAIGTLDSSGKFVDSKTAIFTENYIEVDGLKCEIVTNPTITYKVFYYDVNKTFVSATSDLSEDLSSLIPETAKYFRIQITPTTDGEVTLLEINKYASQLKVTVNK